MLRCLINGLCYILAMTEKEKSHRLFVAIPISEAIQDQVLNFRKNYQNLPVRWLSGKNLHITLVPPWYTQDIASVKEKLESLKGKIQSFNIKFEKISYGPNAREPRLIWASGKTPPQIIELKALSEKALNRPPETGPPEKRDFILHLTLARQTRSERSERSVPFPLDEKIDWVENINSIILMESHLSQKGADYEILQTIPL